VLKGVLLTGRFVIGSSFLVFGRFAYRVFGAGSLFLDSRFWTLVFGRFVLGFSFLGFCFRRLIPGSSFLE
jgi:hypothetical protein